MRKNIIRFFAAGAAATLCAAISVTGKGATLTAEKPLAGITLSLEKYCDAVIEDITREEENDRETQQTVKKLLYRHIHLLIKLLQRKRRHLNLTLSMTGWGLPMYIIILMCVRHQVKMPKS